MPTAPHPIGWLSRSTVRRVFARVVLTGLVGVLAAAGPASLADAESGNGLLRLAHLSPDTPAVDVYVTATTPPPAAADNAPIVLGNVAYGGLSDYQPLPAGDYAVAMRATGADAASPPAISEIVTVAADSAQTVAGVGLFDELSLQTFADDLSEPPAGQARVRVIQGSATNPRLTVGAVDGPVIAVDAEFSQASDYTLLAAGTWTLELEAVGMPITSTSVTVAGGGVYTVVLLDDPSGGLRVLVQTDAATATVTPAGPIEAGEGGAALGAASAWWPVGASFAVGVCCLALAGLRRRRAGVTG